MSKLLECCKQSPDLVNGSGKYNESFLREWSSSKKPYDGDCRQIGVEDWTLGGGGNLPPRASTN